MKATGLWILLLVAIQSPCFAKITKLPAQVQTVLTNTTTFYQIAGVTNLPAAVVKICADPKNRFAEPNQKWEPTDFITDKTLPQARLIWAYSNGSYYVVYYEKGGYAHSFYILVVQLKTANVTKPDFIWRGCNSSIELKNYESFIDALTGNKLDDANN